MDIIYEVSFIDEKGVKNIAILNLGSYVSAGDYIHYKTKRYKIVEIIHRNNDYSLLELKRI